jgi:glycerol-3-phosphate acyltransferase PlsY
LAEKNARLALGVLAGVVSLIGMARLVAGAFSGALSVFAWVFLLLAMLPWVVYVAWRARHSQLRGRAAFAVLVLGLAGLLAVWLFTLGAVAALACSLAAFVVIWVHDWPPRQAGGEDHFVRIEELSADESDEQGGLS